jgi:hypothetical protein
MTCIRILSVLLLFGLLYACKPKETDDGSSVDLGYGYYPVQVGSTWIYDVDSLVYDDNSGRTTIDTFEYQYREMITGTFTDVTGRTAHLVSRAYRNSDTDTWAPANTWTLLKTEQSVQKVQENTRLVKLVFPLNPSQKWDGNAYNSLGEEEYSLAFFGQPYHTPHAQYDKALQVMHQDEENAIEEIRRYEVYAQHTGMVYALSDSLNTQLAGTRGYRFRLTLKSFTP